MKHKESIIAHQHIKFRSRNTIVKVIHQLELRLISVSQVFKNQILQRGSNNAEI